MGRREQLVELAERRSEWMSSVRNGDAEAYADLVTPSVVWVPPSGEAVVGRSAFHAWVEPFFGDFTYELALDPESVVLRGHWAIECGRFLSTLRPRSGGSPGRHEGAYSAIWRRCEDERWRIDRYFDTTNEVAGND